MKAIARLIEFYKHESCGQCTPCREGRRAGQAGGFSVAHAGPGWGTGHRWRRLRTLNTLLRVPSLLWLLSAPPPHDLHPSGSIPCTPAWGVSRLSLAAPAQVWTG